MVVRFVVVVAGFPNSLIISADAAFSNELRSI
uniref:Uncharacterized protein n=1 Tax=Parascaris equorum TaxID=6256 RepID=A0A914R3J8_PAREQ